ncbi:4-oxalocrotonate tautomerase [Aneurinibacillus soli]|uniref:Tautomerase n=1 Tax=Aneurinibacillus soli TaxID=1500254 RepID=A0A0U4WI20_9BACL|nr:4-oxalocrotonate tautomerase [Aneurinibacillus soli]PYE64331.1 4-oxalocrotonate tautomerase [Aneurinibacillus soli]BAU28280.1 2-hydroxymuconate tautomerase [Aneurinibacillus soli]
MPLIQINIVEGRSDEMKRQLMKNVTEVVSETLGSPKEAIRILINEMPKNHWGIGGVPMSDLKK